MQSWYSSARQAATEWRANRTAYLERMMAEGKHPDTHPEILKGMPDTPPMPPMPDKKLSYWMEENSGAVVVIVFSVLLLAMYVFARIQENKKKRAARAA